MIIPMAVSLFIKTAAQLPANPHIGEQLFEFELREVRRIFVGNYEMRYEVQNETISMLRLWHMRKERKDRRMDFLSPWRKNFFRQISLPNT